MAIPKQKIEWDFAAKRFIPFKKEILIKKEKGKYSPPIEDIIPINTALNKKHGK